MSSLPIYDDEERIDLTNTSPCEIDLVTKKIIQPNKLNININEWIKVIILGSFFIIIFSIMTIPECAMDEIFHPGSNMYEIFRVLNIHEWYEEHLRECYLHSRVVFYPPIFFVLEYVD